MNDSSKVWMPGGLPAALAKALSVPNPGKAMTPSLYRELLQQKLDAMIQADPKAAQQAMQMSVENAPGLWSIQQQHPTREWASALMQSDQMTRLLAPLKMPGSLSAKQPQSLLEILELLA